MRIGCLVSQYPAPSHTFIRRELDALRRRGISIHTFSVRPPKREEVTSAVDRQEFEQTWYILPAHPRQLLRAHARALCGHPVQYVKTFWLALRHRVPGVRAFVHALFYFLEAMLLAAELKKRGITHLHNHFANPAAIVGRLASRFLQISWSLTLHGISEFDYPAGLLLAEKVAAANFVACASFFVRAQACRVIDPDHWHKLLVARCGLELSKLQEHRSPQGRKTRIRFVSVGRLSPEKGQIGLIDAFARVLGSGVDAELFLLGDGPERSRLEQRVRDSSLGGRLQLLGRAPEAQTLSAIASADVFVLSSFMEGLPVVLLEAMALGIPVIAPALAGIPELVRHAETGLLFTVGDWTDLAASMKKLAEDETLRTRLAANARERVRIEFDVDRAIEPLVKRYHSLRLRENDVPLGASVPPGSPLEKQ
jgi:colanic acid/amylovoran biosynthesis glycosyltransferase